MITIQNGWIIENNQLVQKDIWIDDGILLRVGRDLPPKGEGLDASGCLVMPGGTDVHVHLRQPGFDWKETIRSGTMAAAKGGITSVMAMPNLIPCPDCKEHLQRELDWIQKDAVVHVYPYGAVTVRQEGTHLSDIASLKDFVLALSDDGMGIQDMALLEQAMMLCKKYDLLIASHAEDKKGGQSKEGEYVAVAREIELAKKIGCRYHFCHLSTKEALEMVRQAHIEGYTNITCEVTPHHLFLNEEMIEDGNWKMNPPLRLEEDRMHTVSALLDQTACCVASDHAPHTEEEKNRPYEKCLNGIIGLETMIPLVYTELIHSKKASLDDLIRWFVDAPRKLFGLDERKIEEGYPADLAVLDITHERVFQKDEILSMGKNSPFIGRKLYGFAIYTLVDGKIVYRRKERS